MSRSLETDSRPAVRSSVTTLFALLALSVLAVRAAPGDDAEPGPAAATRADAGVERGRELFEDTQEGFYPSCAHCHSLLPEREEKKSSPHLGPGSTLYGAAVRAGWRNLNTYADVGEASQTCAKRYQERRRGLTAAQRRALVAYLKTRSPAGPLPKRKVQRRPKLLKDLSGGDPARGRALVSRYCSGCHHAGDDAISPELKPHKKRRAAIALKVRGFNAKRKFAPGLMSYYTNDRLPDEELRHILAWLGR